MKHRFYLSVILSLIMAVIPFIASANQDDIDKYNGKIVSKISLIYENSSIKPAGLPRLKIREGESFSAKNLNYDMVTLFATGNFEDIKVSAIELDGSKVEIRFHLKSAYFISKVTFEGEVPFSNQQLREQASIPYMEKYDETTVEGGARRLISYYNNEGYLNVHITWVFKKESESNSGELIYNLSDAKNLYIHKIEIEGLYSSSEGSNSVVPELPGLKSLQGSRFSKSEINNWLEESKVYLWDNNYLTTDLYLLNNTIDPATGSASLKIKINTDGIISAVFNEKDIDAKIFKSLLEGKPKRKLNSETQLEWSNLVQEYYKRKGYPDVKVYTSVFIMEQRDTVFNISIKKVQFLIIKGKIKCIKGIDFSSNNHITKNELRGLLVNDKDLRSNKILYSTDKVDQWIEQITLFYRSNGYLEAKVLQYEAEEYIQKDGIGVYIKFLIDEGKQSRIKEIQVDGDIQFDKVEIIRHINIEVGDIFIPAVLEKTAAAIRDYVLKTYGIEVVVDAKAYKDNEYNAYITITLNGFEKEYIEQIILNGNFQTDSDFILKCIDCKEGGKLTLSALLSSQLKLYDLGLFANIEFAPLDADIASQGKRVLLKVQETVPILMSWGGGVDTENLVRGTFSISHNNLGGTGKKADFSIALGSKESSAQLNYQAPRILADKWDLFASVYYEQHQRESFGVTRQGAVLQLSTKSSLNMTYLLSFNIENVDLYDIKVSEYLISPDERAVNLTSLSSTMVMDYRNDPFNPRDGFFLSSSIKWANSLLGSKENFLKGYFQGSFYFPVLENIVFALGFRLGVSRVFDENKLLPPSERFFAGGSNTLRAYSLDSVGPKDEETGYPIGGNAMLIANAEVRIPIFGNLGLVLFYDVGSVFEYSEDISIKNLAKSVGIGARFNTPIGPLRVDFGVNPDDYNQNQIYISIGHTF
jgi:outer membrane protein insertion porin family